MNKEKIYMAAVTAVLVIELFMALELSCIRRELGGSIDNLRGEVNRISVDTNGRLASIDKKYDKLAEIKGSAVAAASIEYIPKTHKQDADVELREANPKVTVKVNGGEEYRFDLLENEKSKFDSGKLVLEKKASLDLNLVTDEYKQSRWRITTAANSDKEALFGVSYSLGRSVNADIFIGQHIKPYFGLTWSIGGHK